MYKISFFMPSFSYGGVEKNFITVANEMSNNNYLVNFVVCNYSGELFALLSKKINIVNLKCIRVRKSLFPLIRYIRKTPPDFLISGPDFPNFISILMKLIIRPKTKVIVTQHNFFDVECKKLGIHGKIQPLLIRLLYPQSDKIISVSNGITEYLISHGINKKKIKKIYNPIDISFINYMADCLPEPNIDNLPKDYILFIGRLSSVKNIELIIKSFDIIQEKLSEVKLLIIGDGEERKKLEYICKNLQMCDRVIFLGALINPFYFLKRCRLLAISSLSESLSIVTIEALSLGKNVVSTPCSGPIEVLNNGEFGYISKEFNNENEYASLLVLALQKPLSNELLKRRSMDFDISKIIAEYQNLFSDK